MTASAHPIFITAVQVADLLGLPDARAFLRQRARLETDEGFPPVVALQRKTLRWTRDEVLAWATMQGRRQMLPQVPAGANVVLLDIARGARA